MSKTDTGIIDCLTTGIHLSSCLCVTSHVIVTVLSHCVAQNGDTALIWASYRGHTGIIRELLSGGAQVDLQDKVRHKCRTATVDSCKTWH